MSGSLYLKEMAVKTFGIVCQYKYCNSQSRIDLVQSKRERERRLKINFNSILLSPISRDCLFFLYTEQLMPQYIKDLDNKLHYARMGFALGLGALPKRILEGQLDTVNK